jgi:nanoRNase/pAp phosphatase (c-di-AMP/oligoRNAs hydrolase)
MLKFGGGGHQAAGTCQLGHSLASAILAEFIEESIMMVNYLNRLNQHNAKPFT